MHNDLDLYVKQKGQWSMYRMYSASNEQTALKDAHFLEREKLYEAILLMDETNRTILFSAGMPPGQRLSYSALRREIKTAEAKTPHSVSDAALQNLSRSRTERQIAKTAQKHHKSQSASAALKVGLTGFGLTLLVAFGLASLRVSDSSIALVFTIMGTATLGLTIWAYSLHERGPRAAKEVTPKEEATKQIELQKKLRTSHETLKEAFYLGKVYIWQEDSQTFKKDGHFALILYMLGMSQGFKNALALPHGKTQQQIAELFAAVGISPESIVNCAANLSEYLIYPRYYAVYQKGVTDVTALHENAQHQISLQHMFEDWYSASSLQDITYKNPNANALPPTATAEQSKTVATQEEQTKGASIPRSNFAVVVFTDIVDSTEKMQTNGEAWMIDVLQTHNTIVRDAINTNGGHEVKHTGDGIMMSFPTVEAGLQAGVTIQQNIANFNTQEPEKAFTLRIGMSAGEPTQIDGDLFGLPVNLAARVLPFAGEGQIALSAQCHQLCEGLPYAFSAQENCIFKGFSEPQTVYFLQWEPANQEAPNGAPSETAETPTQGVSAYL